MEKESSDLPTSQTTNTYDDIPESEYVKASEETIKIIANCDDYLVVSVKKDKQGQIIYRTFTTDELLAPLFLQYLATQVDRMFDATNLTDL